MLLGAGRWFGALLLLAFVLSADDRSDAAERVLASIRADAAPGCAIAVMRDGHFVYSSSFGLADLDSRTPITASTPFNVASLSKQFTAASLYFLIESGKVRLTDSVRAFVPELPAYTAAITIADLLHHTSGLRDVHPLLEISGRLYERLDESANLAVLAAQSALNFAPGTDYEYTNSDYLLLGIVIERVSGVRLAEFADRHIFRPLGMTHSAFHQVEGRALGYMPRGPQFRRALPSPLNAAAAGLFTTLEDLLLWDENFYSAKVGGKGLIAFLESPGRLRSGEPVHYAAGLTLGRYRGARFVAHGGLLPGYRSDLARFPAHHLSTATLCNRADADAPGIDRTLAAIYLAGHLKSRPAAADIEYATSRFPELDGVWESKQGWILRAWSAVDGLSIETGGEKHKVAPLSRRQLFADESGFRLLLSVVSPDSFTLAWDDSPPVTYQRIHPVEQGRAALAAFAGEYRSTDADATYKMVAEDGRLVLTTAAGWRIPLDPVGSDRFLIGAWSLRFLRNAEGDVRGLELHRARLWNLWFEKTY